MWGKSPMQNYRLCEKSEKEWWQLLKWVKQPVHGCELPLGFKVHFFQLEEDSGAFQKLDGTSASPDSAYFCCHNATWQGRTQVRTVTPFLTAEVGTAITWAQNKSLLSGYHQRRENTQKRKRQLKCRKLSSGGEEKGIQPSLTVSTLPSFPLMHLLKLKVQKSQLYFHKDRSNIKTGIMD